FRKVRFELGRYCRFKILIRLCVAVRSNVRRGGRQKVSRINEVGEARLPVNLNNGHQVQTQECKVSEVVAGQRFALQMRMHTSKPSEAARGCTGTAEVGHL